MADTETTRESYKSEETRRPLDIFKEAWGACCTATITLIFLGISCFIPIAVIVIGAVTLDDCPTEHWIPRFLLVSGCISLLKILLNLCCRIKDRVKEDSSQTPADCLISILGFILLIVMILGSIWVYSNFIPETKSDASNKIRSAQYCNPVTYWVAFLIVTLWWVFGILACCLSCLFCCVHACRNS